MERDFKTLIVLALAILAKGVENLSLSHGMKTVAPPEAPTPPGFRAAAIGVSQDYDSVGELSRGAYGVIRSHDGGKTWGRPLYTGLRIQAPYVVRPASNLPLLAGDRMRFEATATA